VTCTASCPAALQALAASVGCCWAELVYVNLDSTVTYTTANEWGSCGVTFPGECANLFTTETATTRTDSMATTLTECMTTGADSMATASAEGLLVTGISHCVLVNVTKEWCREIALVHYILL